MVQTSSRCEECGGMTDRPCSFEGRYFEAIASEAFEQALDGVAGDVRSARPCRPDVVMRASGALPGRRRSKVPLRISTLGVWWWWLAWQRPYLLCHR